MAFSKNRRFLAFLLGSSFALPACAHNGPPFPIIVDRKIGPVVASLWTHPDIGVGTFWVIIEPPPGGKIPAGLKLQVAVQPVSGRIPERVFAAPRDETSAQVQYKSEVPFDRQELVRARLIVESPKGGGEASATVEITPVGPARWELYLYLTPFLGVAFLWLRTFSRKKRRGVAGAHGRDASPSGRLPG